MDKIKEEIRLVIAFALAVIIILVFGKIQARQAPQTAAPQKTPATVSGVRETAEESKTLALAPKTDSISDKEENYEDERYIIKADTAGGLIRDIRLKEYTKKGETSIAIIENSDLLSDYADGTDPLVYTLAGITGNRVEFRGFLHNMPVEKTIAIPEDSYTFKSSVVIRNNGGETANLSKYAVSAGTIEIHPGSRMARSEFTPSEIILNTNGKTVKHNLRTREILYENTAWLAIKQRYGLLFIRPETTAKSYVLSDNGRMQIGFIYDNIAIDAGKETKLDYLFYAGPSDYFVARNEVTEKDVFGTGLFASMGRFLFTALASIHKVVPNWGWAIILLTLIVKIVFFPLTRKSLQSMKGMQKLRPYLQDIQKKYKDNPQQMQKELMNLYKEYNINPFGGCLPMLIQFPIFIGFFIALRNSIYLRGASFGLWITDLSQPDTITRIGDFNLNLLPIIMAATSFWQQKLTPQEPSQKALVYMMPIMFLFLFYNFSSGLLLYWITMNIMGLVEQYFVHKK